MSEGVDIPISVDDDGLSRAVDLVQRLDATLNRLNVDKVAQQLSKVTKELEQNGDTAAGATQQLQRYLQQAESQAGGLAAKYSAAYGQLGTELKKTYAEVQTLSTHVKELNKLYDMNYKASESYRQHLQKQTDVLRTNSAQQTANAEAIRRTTESNNRLRAELTTLQGVEGKRASMLREQVAAEQARQKAGAQAFTLQTRLATQAQQLANRQAELNSEVGRSNLITQVKLKGQEQEITFSARQANALSELQNRLRYLNTEEGKSAAVAKERIKQKEMLATLDVRRRNNLANLRREVKELGTEDGKAAEIAKAQIAYKQQIATLDVNRSNALKLLRRDYSYLNTTQAQEAAILRENIKYKTETLALDTRRSNSLKRLESDLRYAQSAEGQKAARLRESIKYEQEVATAETRRQNTLRRLQADLAAMNSETGRKIAQTQQEIRIQRELDAAESKRVSTIRQLQEVQTAEAQQQIHKIERLRRENELSRKKAELDAREATMTQQLALRKRELQMQLESLSKSQHREVLLLERKVLEARRAAQVTSQYSGALGMLHTSLMRTSASLNVAAQTTAGFRASIMGAGASFGIFTSSTILVATAVYSTVRAFRESITAGAEFESTMDRVAAVMDVTGNSSQMLEQRVRSLAATTVFTGTEVSQGMLYLGMAGMQTADAVIAIEPALRLASIGMLDMGTTADIVTNILYGFNLTSEQLTDVVDNMAYAITSSNMDIQQLGNAMSYVAPLAREADISLQEVVASLQSLHNAGIKASRAGTGMRTTMLALLAPTEKAQGVLDKYGITIDDHTGRMRNWTQLLEEFAQAKLTMGEVENLVGKRQAAAFKIMIDAAKHTEEYKTKLEELGVTGVKTASELRYLTEALHMNEGAAKAMQEVLEDNLRGDSLKMISAFQEKMLEFYDQNKEYYRDLIQGVTEWIKSFDVNQIQVFFEAVRENLKQALQLIMAIKSVSMGAAAGGAIGALIGSAAGPGGTLIGGAVGKGIGGTLGGVGGYYGAGALLDWMTPDIQDNVNQQLVNALVGDQELVEYEARNIIRKYGQASLSELVGYYSDLQDGLAHSARLMAQTKAALEEAIRIDAEGSTAAAREEIRQLQALLSSIQANIDDMTNRARGIELVANKVSGGLTEAEARNTLNSLQFERQQIAAERERLAQENKELEAAAIRNQGFASRYHAIQSLSGERRTTAISRALGGRDAEGADTYQQNMQRMQELEVRSREITSHLASVQGNLSELQQANLEAQREYQDRLQGINDDYDNRIAAVREEFDTELALQQRRISGQELLNELQQQQQADIARFNELADLSVILEQRRRAEAEGNVALLAESNQLLDDLGLTAETANASYREGQRLKDTMLERDREIYQLQERMTQEAERSAQAAERSAEQSRRRTIQEARALAQAEKAYAQSQKELRDIVDYNANLQHRNQMLQRGVLLLDDQDFQMVRAIEAQRELIQELAREIELRYLSGEISGEVLEKELARLEVERAKVPALQQQREEMLKGSEVLSEQYRTAVRHKEALEQMYSSMESATIRLLESGLRDTKSFFDSIVSQFKRMLAELAYQAAIKPIVVNMVAGVGQTFFGQQAAQAFAQSQGVQLGGVGGGAMTMGQMASTGWNFFKGGGQSAQMAEIGGRIATSSFGQMVGLSTPAASGLGAGVAAHPGAGGFVPSPTLTSGGQFLQTGMSYAPWGIVGGLGANLFGFQGSGNMIADTVLQTGGAIAGAGLGAQLGSLGGPIGAIAGAFLGTVLGSLFGGGDKSYRMRGQMGTSAEDRGNRWLAPDARAGEEISAESAFGFTNIHVNKYGDVKQFQSFLNSVVEMDNFIAAALSKSEVDNVRQSLDGWRMGGARGDQNSLTGTFLNRRMDLVYNAADPHLKATMNQAGVGYGIGHEQFAMVFTSLKYLSEELVISANDVSQMTTSLYQSFKEGSEKVGETLTRLVANFSTVNAAVQSLGMTLSGSAATQVGASANIISQMGGEQEFLAGINSFYNTFTSEEERAAIFLKQLTKELEEMNITLPETAEGYKELTLSSNLATKQGQEQFANLLKLSELAGVYYQNLETWKEQIDQVFNLIALRSPDENELDAWLTKLKTGQMTLTQVIEAIREAAMQASLILNESQQSQLFDLAMEVADGYAYTIKLIEEEHEIRLAGIQAQEQFLQNIRNIMNSLMLSNLSPLTPQERLVEARSQYDTLVSQLESGDYRNAGQFQSAAQALLTEASNVFSSSENYLTIFAEVMSQLAAFEAELEALPSVEERQQASLDQLVEEQARAADVLAQQLEMAGRQVDAQMNLLDVLRNLPAELSESLAAIIGLGFMDNIPKTPILPNGTHSAGLAYVPYDGYTAVLHKGEQIVPSSVRRREDATEAMVEELRQLRGEVAKLRQDQQKHKDEMIRAQFASTDAAANKTVKGTKDTAKEVEWQRKRGVEIK